VRIISGIGLAVMFCRIYSLICIALPYVGCGFTLRVTYPSIHKPAAPQ